MSDLKENTEGSSRRIQFWGSAVIILMIVLMLMPWNIGQRTRNGQQAVLRGTANGGLKVTSIDVQSALATMETLEGLYVTVNANPMDPNGGRADVPLLTAVWGSERVNTMKRHPEAFHLLVEESRKFGLGENPRTLGSLDRDSQNAKSEGVFNSGYVFVRELHPLFGSPLYEAAHTMYGPAQQVTQISIPQLQTATADGHVVRISPTALPPIQQQSIYAALRDFLSIQAAASLASIAIKPSTVMVDQIIAREGQTYTLNVASIDARPLNDLVSVPTDAELQAQLTKYGNIPSGSVTPENPFGFGYQLNNAVKLQMLVLNRPEIRAVVEAEKSAYEWEVEARMAYARDASAFKSLAATKPSTEPTTAPAATPAKPAAEDVAPFDQIKAGAVRIMLEKATDARLEEIMRKIRTTMSLDYQAWLTSKNTHSATQPSSLGVDYESVDYLNKLAGSIQTEPRFKVLPVVRSEQSKFLDGEELSLNPVLSTLGYRFQENVARQLRLQTIAIPAAQYIVEYAKPFMKQSVIEKAGGAVLETLKPSDPLSDYAGDSIVFLRVTDTRTARPATEIDPIRARLINDVKRAAAQEQALAKAQTAVETIKTSGKFEVPGASVATVTVNPPAFDKASPPELGLTGAAYAQFHGELGRKLLGEPNGQPIAAINVPLAQKVFVAQRIALKSNWTSDEELNQNRIVFQGAMTDRMAQPKSSQNLFGLTDQAIGSDWLAIDAVYARNGWVSASGKDEDGEKSN